MASITFSSTDQSPFTAPNGVVYVWVTPGNFWMASGDNLTDVYLSKTGDDTAAGEITFEGETTHQSGVLVDGSGADRPGVTNQKVGVNVASTIDEDDITYLGVHSTIDCNNHEVTSIRHFTAARIDNSDSSVLTNVMGFHAPNSLQTGIAESDTLTTIAGFQSTLPARADGKAWNIYAGGTAPSFFNGGVQFSNAAGTSVLDTYEEGTWTPTVTSGDLGTPNNISGAYEKIGSVVYVRMTMTWSTNFSLAAGGITIGGLPFSGGTGRHCGLVILGTQNNTIRDLGVASAKVQDRDIRIRINNAASVNILSVSGTYH